MSSDNSCSFCRKSHRDVGPLVEGPDRVYICGDCVELCQSIIPQERHRRDRPAEPPPVPAAEIIRCCRRFWQHLSHEECRRAVAVAERFTDGNALLEEQAVAGKAAWKVYRTLADAKGPWKELEAAGAAAMAATRHARAAAASAAAVFVRDEPMPYNPSSKSKEV